MADYTSGPWDVTTVDHSSGGGGGIPSTLFRIGFPSHKDFTGHVAAACHRDRAANARLIAAAPELLEALQGLANALEAKPGPRGVMELVPAQLENARAVIRKARGE